MTEQDELNIRIEEAVTDYMTANKLDGFVEVVNGGIKLGLPTNTDNVKMHSANIQKIVDAELGIFHKKMGLDFSGCTCGHCGKSYNFNNLVEMCVRSAMDNIPVEINENNKIDDSKQMQAIVQGIMILLKHHKMI